MLVFLLSGDAGAQAAAQASAATDRQAFTHAWQAAASGKRTVFEQMKTGLQGYSLYPYLQYEDLRFRRLAMSPVDGLRVLQAINTQD